MRSRIESMELEVETVHLSPTVSLADALDDAAQRGLLYAIIITSQHEMHRSVTLTILHGRNPQGKGSEVVNYDSTHGVITRGINRPSPLRETKQIHVLQFSFNFFICIWFLPEEYRNFALKMLVICCPHKVLSFHGS